MHLVSENKPEGSKRGSQFRVRHVVEARTTCPPLSGSEPIMLQHDVVAFPTNSCRWRDLSRLLVDSSLASRSCISCELHPSNHDGSYFSAHDFKLKLQTNAR